MIFQGVDFIQTIADIVAAILNFLRLFINPMGEFMVNWMEFVLQFFPQDNLTVYIIIAIVIVVIGLIVNIAWPGEKKPGFLVKAEEIDEKIEKKPKDLDKKVEEKEEELEEVIEEFEEPTEELEEKTKELEEVVEELEEEAVELEEEAEELNAKIEELDEELEKDE